MRLLQIFGDQRAAAAIEYGLLAALIAVAGIGAFTATGDGVESTMNDAADALPDPGVGGGGAPPTP
jgi:pilus assembly protein Flp/PilA